MIKKSAWKLSLGAIIACIGMGAIAYASSGVTSIANVNGRTITSRDLVEALGGLNEGQRKTVLEDPNSRRQILSGLIEQELLMQQAEREKLDQDAEYKNAFAAFRKQYLANRVLQRDLGAKITDAAARKYYEANKSRFSTDEVYVQHILLRDEKEARDILKLAKAKGADFQKLAEKYSKDPSAKNNRGDIGPIRRNSPFVPAFKDAAFSASEGAIVGPVKTSYGYHIIKVVKKKIGHPLNYDEVELQVKNELRQQLVENYVGKLKERAKIKIDDKALDRM